MFARHWMFKTGFWGFGSNQRPARETNQDISSSEVPSPIDGLVAVCQDRNGWKHPTDSHYDHYVYPPKVSHSPWKIVVGRLLSYWEGNFSGAMLNLGSVLQREKKNQTKYISFHFNEILLEKHQISMFLLGGCVFLRQFSSLKPDLKVFTNFCHTGTLKPRVMETASPRKQRSWALQRFLEKPRGVETLVKLLWELKFDTSPHG